MNTKCLDLESDVYYSAGGFGDALFILNKFKTLGLDKKPNVKLYFYSDVEQGVALAKGLFERNGVSSENVILNPTLNTLAYFKKLKDKNQILSTIWNGKIDPTDTQRLDWSNPDEVEISPRFDIQGEADFEPVVSSAYFVVQVDAGLQYHNPRKHWTALSTIRQFASVLSRKLGIPALIVGDQSQGSSYDNVINVSDAGYGIIDYIKGAKFVVGLSGFRALLLSAH